MIQYFNSVSHPPQNTVKTSPDGSNEMREGVRILQSRGEQHIQGMGPLVGSGCRCASTCKPGYGYLPVAAVGGYLDLLPQKPSSVSLRASLVGAEGGPTSLFTIQCGRFETKWNSRFVWVNGKVDPSSVRTRQALKHLWRISRSCAQTLSPCHWHQVCSVALPSPTH